MKKSLFIGVLSVFMLLTCGGAFSLTPDSETPHPVQKEAPDLVRIFSPGNVEPGMNVRDVVLIFSDGTVSGEVMGDCVVLGGKLELRREAVVEGDLVCIFSTVNIDRESVVKGSQVSIGSHQSTAAGHFLKDIFSAWDFLLALFLLLFFWKHVHIWTDRFLQVPARCVLEGFVAMLAFAPLLLLFAISIIGIFLIPFVPFLYLAGFVLGFAVMGNLAGDYIARMLKKEMSQPMKAILGLGAMLVAAKLVALVPLVGWLSAEMLKMVIRTAGLGLLWILISEAAKRRKAQA